MCFHQDWASSQLCDSERGATTVDVNEQNDQALGFYLRMGFVVVGRSELDSNGKPYPLLHMRLASVNGKR
ncbi:MAG: GNAT family N-acetyltransferase [Chloroflexi bacterium]|nr:MAG: GNAT family N-acetyltransferase [Chloroflexota bacterium]